MLSINWLTRWQNLAILYSVGAALICLSPKLALASDGPNAHHYSLNCWALHPDRTPIRHYPGERCIFLSDGRLVSGGANHLSLYSPDMLILWTKKINTHHDLKLSRDGRRILVLSSKVHPYKGKKVRFDKIIVFDLLGSELASLDFFEIIEKLTPFSHNPRLIPGPISPDDPMIKALGTNLELSHANSIYEIPPNDSADQIEAFRPGNLLVNVDHHSIVIVFDPSLKKILWMMPQFSDGVFEGRQHDVQMQKNGRLLIFNNYSIDGDGKYSTIDEFDPVTQRRTVLYRANPPHSFAAPICGSVQRLPGGGLLISDSTQGGEAYEVDSSGRVIWKFRSFETAKDGRPRIFSEIRRLDLTSFLKENQFH